MGSIHQPRLDRQKNHVSVSLTRALAANKRVVALLEEDFIKKPDITLEKQIDLEYAVIETLSTEQIGVYDALYEEWKIVKSKLPESDIKNYIPRALGIFLSKKHVDIEGIKTYFRHIEDTERAEKIHLWVLEMQEKAQKISQQWVWTVNPIMSIDRGMPPTTVKVGDANPLRYNMKAAVKPTFPDMIRAGRQLWDTLPTTQVVRI